MKMTSLVSARGRTYIGPIPEEVISGRLAFRKIPSEAWQAAHPPGIECEPPTDADMVVQIVVLGTYTPEPSRLKPPQQWETGQFPVVELAVVPYLDWKAAADLDIRRQRGELLDEPPTEPMPDPKMEPAVEAGAATAAESGS